MNPSLTPRHSLDQKIITLRDNVLRLSAMDDAAIEQAIQALRQQLVDVARSVIADDKNINLLRYQIEKDAYTLIARHQPTARDLRCILVAIHIASELERIGDYAANIATLSLNLAQQAPLQTMFNIPRVVEICRGMLHDALDSYVQWNVDQAREVIERDKEVDELTRMAYKQLLTHMLEDSTRINRATYLLWILHNLERIADRATNICERVIYMVTGEVQHLTVAHHDEQLGQP